MQTTNWRAEIKATYLPSDSGRNSEERTPADLNGFQLWARWWYTVGCSKERWWALQTHQESKLWPRHTIRDFQTKLPPPTLCATEFFFSFSFFFGKLRMRPRFTGKRLAEILPCIPEVTYKSHRARGSSLTPFAAPRLLFIITLRSHRKQPEINTFPSIKTAWGPNRRGRSEKPPCV